jgi:hypothetical protein
VEGNPFSRKNREKNKRIVVIYIYLLKTVIWGAMSVLDKYCVEKVNIEENNLSVDVSQPRNLSECGERVAREKCLCEKKIVCKIAVCLKHSA